MREADSFYSSNEYLEIMRVVLSTSITPDGFTSKPRNNIELREFMEDPAIFSVSSFLKNVKKTQVIVTGLSSYRLKHWLEESKSIYISNGAFIVGAILSGCQVRRTGKNALFNISQKSFTQNL